MTKSSLWEKLAKGNNDGMTLFTFAFLLALRKGRKGIKNTFHYMLIYLFKPQFMASLKRSVNFVPFGHSAIGRL